MKTKLATSCFVIGTLPATIAVLAEHADSDRMQPTICVRDPVITTKIKASLAKEKMCSPAHVHVDTDSDGAVYLSGHVRSQGEARTRLFQLHTRPKAWPRSRAILKYGWITRTLLLSKYTADPDVFIA